MNITEEVLKQEVHDFWNNQSCGTQFTNQEKFSRSYFDEIEQDRYSKEPEIFSFAQFTRYSGKKILEVGIGAATDFLQWKRAGAEVYGVDLTEEAVRHAQQRFELYGLEATDIRVADCEHLPHPDDYFDVVYSFGVIHHTPNTEKALQEIIRVCKPGGICKVMLYNRHSILSFFFWIKYALLKGRPWKSFAWCLANYMESKNTKAFTKKEVLKMLQLLPVNHIRIFPVITYYDRLERFGKLSQFLAATLIWIFGGNRVGWFLMLECTKI